MRSVRNLVSGAAVLLSCAVAPASYATTSSAVYFPSEASSAAANDSTGNAATRLAYYGSGLIPGSNIRWLTRRDLYGLSPAELRIARNEIYARYGCIFHDRGLQNYFNAQSWYYPVPGLWADDFNGLNAVERHNVNLILQMER